MKPVAIAWAAVVAALALAPAAACAHPLGSGSAQIAPKPFLDSRKVSASVAVRSSDRTLRARKALLSALGSQGQLDVNPATGTPRVLQRLDRALTPSARGDRAAIALEYAKQHAAALGLGDADFSTFRLAERVVSPDGVMHLRWQQSYRGIPLFDNDLRVNVDAAGRVVNVLGSPRHDPAVGSIDPLLSPLAALERVMDGAGGRRPATVASGPAGAQQTTRFASGDSARLVLFGEAGDVRLAWQVDYRASRQADYDAVLDARTGALLYRANVTKFDDAASVWENYPGAPDGGDAQLQDLGPWLTPSASTLNGPNAHVWSDLDANGSAPGPGEEIQKVSGDFDFSFIRYAPQPVPLTDADPLLCPLDHKCSWDQVTPDSWTVNRRQNGVQAFYFVNRFHDHLLAAPIGFNEASGAFDAGNPLHPDPLRVHADAGAALLTAPNSDTTHENNASMSVHADGAPPVMELDLFRYDTAHPYREINAGDDAVTVYHEYTHGLSGRLIHNGAGEPALSSAQAGAMSEGWSDWYAEDYLVQRTYETDAFGPGDIDVGRYPDYVPNTTRSQPADCSVGSGSALCPGGLTGTRGGYTYGDFGHVAAGPEVHADGEIWLETLWDLRSALVAQLGQVQGSQAAERLITGGMRLSPPEPSFLDMRNAILAADAANAGAHYTALLWTVFSHRGMGYYAATTGGNDLHPVENFTPPPPPGGPKGAVSGRVTDADTGLPLGGAVVGIGGHSTNPSFADFFRTTTFADGTFHLGGVPAASYPQLNASASPAYDSNSVSLQVAAGTTANRSIGLHRDWSALASGATAYGISDDDAHDSCGPLSALDQSQTRGWAGPNPTSPENSATQSPSMTVQLSRRVDISSFLLDPGNTCGDDATATVRDFRIETAHDAGGPWNCAAATAAGAGCSATAHQFTTADAHRLNLVLPHGNTRSVGFVRITLLGPVNAAGGSGRNFIDLAELKVYGGPSGAVPAGALTASTSPVTKANVTFSASSFTDPDYLITTYSWDLDGNGSFERTTGGPATSFAYSSAGKRTVRVLVTDFHGTQGTAQLPLTVLPPRPSILVRRLSKGRARATVKCSFACTISSSLTIAPAALRRAHLRTKAIKARAKLKRAGTARITLSLPASVRRALLHARIRTLSVTVRVTATDSKHRASHAKKVLKLKL